MESPIADCNENIYFKHFSKERPENVRSIEQIVKVEKTA
jgi:hypothetical protein